MNWLFSPQLTRVLTIMGTAAKVVVVLALAWFFYMEFGTGYREQNSALYQASW